MSSSAPKVDRGESLKSERDRDAFSLLSARYLEIRGQSLAISTPLSAEDQNIQTMDDVSPTKWHLAHTTWFFETFLLQAHVEGYQPFHPQYGYLFNSYYNAIGTMHPRARRGLLSRPSLEEIRAYRAHVDGYMSELLGTDNTDIAPIITLGLHHEQQHQELMLTDIKHVLSCNPLNPAYRNLVRGPSISSQIEWQEFPGGLYQTGHVSDNTTFEGFAFDNEGPVHKTWLEPYALADRPVTNGEYLAFIEDGGYTRPEFWMSEGWTLIQDEDWEAPLYWIDESEGRSIFTLGGRCGLDLNEPVCHVSQFEADAYARWVGNRLPTEVEWECAARSVDGGGNFADHEWLHPQSTGNAGLRQMFGDIWEWTSSAYSSYPGFKPAKGAIGEYNGKFMSSQMVLRGGSCVTPIGHIRPSYRNFFYPRDRWQFSGIRLAKDL